MMPHPCGADFPQSVHLLPSHSHCHLVGWALFHNRDFIAFALIVQNFWRGAWAFSIPRIVSGHSLQASAVTGSEPASCRWWCTLSSYHVHLCVPVLMALTKVFEVGGGDGGVGLNVMSKDM